MNLAQSDLEWESRMKWKCTRQISIVFSCFLLAACPVDGGYIRGPSGRVDVINLSPGKSAGVDGAIVAYLLRESFVEVPRTTKQCETSQSDSDACYRHFRFTEKMSSDVIDVAIYLDSSTGYLIYRFDEASSRRSLVFSSEACDIYTNLNKYVISITTPEQVLRGGNFKGCPQYDGVLSASGKVQPVGSRNSDG